MTHCGRRIRLIASAGSSRARHGPRPRRPSPADAPYRLTCDELLHFAIRWVKENRGGGPDFVEQVALVFEMLQTAPPRVTLLVESYAVLVWLAANNVGRLHVAQARTFADRACRAATRRRNGSAH